jgi:probable rRNA maturation factor|tara:strand:- start:1480 stop:1860 length:381 start_codon:yes stop_codon:yes gene_type:complete
MAVKRWLSGVISSGGKKLGDISVILCSDDYLLDVNNKYLDHNYYTDIITFDYTEKDVVGGDLFISYDRVKENAKQEGVLIQQELRRVMVHGVLHLLGLKDKTKKEASIMRAAEDVALKMFHVEHSK